MVVDGYHWRVDVSSFSMVSPLGKSPEKISTPPSMGEAVVGETDTTGVLTALCRLAFLTLEVDTFGVRVFNIVTPMLIYLRQCSYSLLYFLK